MSLSARIVLRSSRRLAICESLLVAGGFVVAAIPLVLRWPAWCWLIGAGAAACMSLTWIFRKTYTGLTIAVSDRPEVGVVSMDGDAVDDASWRIAEGTMVWPGFCVVALACAGRARRTTAVFDRDLRGDDRRALHRFLLWSLRGGAGRRPGEA